MRKNKLKAKIQACVRRLAAAATFVVLFRLGGMEALAKAAHQKVIARDLVDNFILSALGINQLINMISYVGGCGLVITGILKLKLHVDNPAANPMKDGLIRLFVAGALLSLPFMTGVAQGSIAGNRAGLGPAIAKMTTASGTCSWYGSWVCH